MDEVAEFGKDLATLLNQGKSHELFNLWSGQEVSEEGRSGEGAAAGREGQGH